MVLVHAQRYAAAALGETHPVANPPILSGKSALHHWLSGTGTSNTLRQMSRRAASYWSHFADVTGLHMRICCGPPIAAYLSSAWHSWTERPAAFNAQSSSA